MVEAQDAGTASGRMLALTGALLERVEMTGRVLRTGLLNEVVGWTASTWATRSAGRE